MDSSSVPMVFLPLKKAGQPGKKPSDTGTIKSSFANLQYTNATYIAFHVLCTSGGRGSFQAVKLQRPARAAVCSHSARDATASARLSL